VAFGVTVSNGECRWQFAGHSHGVKAWCWVRAGDIFGGGQRFDLQNQF
jgi:hypothetical protein